MVVRVGNRHYILPTLSVVTSLKPNEEMVTNVFQNSEFIKVHEKLIPIFRVHRFFDIPDSIEEICEGIVVIVEESGVKAAIFVDELVSKQNIVRKNLSYGMQEILCISGGTIMPDGKVCLILDTGDIVSMSNTLQEH
jgi:two-component system chemotaxis sensor kinase CheA